MQLRTAGEGKIKEEIYAYRHIHEAKRKSYHTVLEARLPSENKIIIIS